MKRILEKLRSKRGETLVGILVAILIIALSAGMFAAMYSASMNIDLSAQKQDELFYEAVGVLEEMKESDNTTTLDGSLQYKFNGYIDEKGTLQYKSDGHSESVNVDYLTQDGLTVYKSKTSTGGTP